MSATTAKNQKSNQPALVTTGQGAALYVTLGVTLMTLGCLWLLSMLMDGGSSEILRQLALTLYGLCGPLCPALPLLLIWCGVKLMVAARHKVAVRDILIISALYWLVLAGHTLIARVLQGTSSVPYLDYVGNVNFQGMPADHGGLSDYLYLAFKLDVKAGGMLGMLLAYPLWKLLSRVGAILFVLAAGIALLFVLFRVNPGDLFRNVSDRSEQRQIRREQKRAEKEQARQAREQAAVAQHPAPVVQEMPMNDLQPGQMVQREETVYTTPDYYHSAPIYNAQPVYSQPQPASQDASGFYPVQPDLYDERFPLHDQPQQPVQEPIRQPAQETVDIPVQQPAAPVPAANEPQPQEEEDEGIIPHRFRRRRYHEKAQESQHPAAEPAKPVAQSPAVSEKKPGPQPEQEEQAKPTVPVTKAQPIQQQTVARPQPMQKPVLPSITEDENEEDDLPWEVPVRQPNATASRPSASGGSSRPAASGGDWASQVQRKQAEISQDMPVHTTAKNDPKPVYTDPVMPITGERIPITPRRENDDPNAKLDGTSAPKVKQGSVGMNIPYQAPPIRLLNEGRQVPQENAAQEDEQRAQIIENTLRSFGVESEVKQIMHGPAITRFAIQIAPGVKVSRVANTAENLALDLKTKHVRVEAPIQGTSYIGIEVPNQKVSTVSLRDVLDSPEMHNNPSPLLVALGKDIAGAPILCDLSKMPHLLIAGATGSGKSVCINSIVCSLLYRTSPDQVRLIMIDPKQVELSVYNSIPHLLVPVVSDPKKAAGALSWVVQEMLERYGKFSAQGVRNLAGYNKVNQGTDQVLPNIVVIIDEMADLMEVCRKDVEESIRRLAALARAAGIYMVLATQRPSVDVITGVIKNNIPSRIAFAVSSGTDSRTIIDINGAEKLMGKGDMLYKPAGTSPTRVQGCFVSDEEVNAITEYIGSRYQTDYDVNIVEHLDNAGKEREADETTGFDDGNGSVAAGSGPNEGEFHDLLQAAIEMAVEDGQTSTSMLQRRLRVGYARAGRLIDEMEKRGIISQSEGSKPRKTLMTREQYYEMLQDGG